jgi:hypothetical protein
MQKILELRTGDLSVDSVTDSFRYISVDWAIRDGWRLLGPPLFYNTRFYWWLEKEEATP